MNMGDKLEVAKDVPQKRFVWTHVKHYEYVLQEQVAVYKSLNESFSIILKGLYKVGNNLKGKKREKRKKRKKIS